jgi:hypothetical protein
MQPASSTGADRSRQVRRWGPIAAVLVLIAIVGGIVLATRDSGEDASYDTTYASARGTTVQASSSVASA